MKRAAALVICSIRVASAEPAEPANQAEPDPAAARAAEANLESTANRNGVTFTVAIGPSFTLGGAPVGAGTGGAVSLRVGHVATPSTVILFEVEGGAQFHKKGVMGDLVANNDTNLLAGVQLWVGPSLWVRAMGGVGFFRGNDLAIGNNPSANIHLVGPAGAVGAGVDLARWNKMVLGIELFSVNMINREGLLSSNGLSMSLAFD